MVAKRLMITSLREHVDVSQLVGSRIGMNRLEVWNSLSYTGSEIISGHKTKEQSENNNYS